MNKIKKLALELIYQELAFFFIIIKIITMKYITFNFCIKNILLIDNLSR